MNQAKKRSCLWLAVAICAAVLCGAVRLWQRNSAFEGSLNLPVPMAPASVILLVLLAVSAVVMALLARKQPVAQEIAEKPELALHAGNDTLFLFAMVCSAFLTLVAAPVFFLDGRAHWVEYQTLKNAAFSDGSVPGGNNGVLMLAAGFTSVLGFFGLIMVTKAVRGGGKRGRMGILAPAVNSCLWLMELYRGHAAEPVRWNYAPLLVAVVAGIVLYLDFAGMLAGDAAPRRMLWFGGMTVVCSAVALAGEWDLSSALLLAAQVFTALAVLWCVPDNLRYPPEVPTEEPPAEEKLEEETHE